MYIIPISDFLRCQGRTFGWLDQIMVADFLDHAGNVTFLKKLKECWHEKGDQQ